MILCQERLQCVRGKQVLVLLVCRPSHLKIFVVIAEVHSYFKSQTELRTSTVGSALFSNISLSTRKESLKKKNIEGNIIDCLQKSNQ